MLAVGVAIPFVVTDELDLLVVFKRFHLIRTVGHVLILGGAVSGGGQSAAGIFEAVIEISLDDPVGGHRGLEVERGDVLEVDVDEGVVIFFEKTDVVPVGRRVFDFDVAEEGKDVIGFEGAAEEHEVEVRGKDAVDDIGGDHGAVRVFVDRVLAGAGDGAIRGIAAFGAEISRILAAKVFGIREEQAGRPVDVVVFFINSVVIFAFLVEFGGTDIVDRASLDVAIGADESGFTRIIGVGAIVLHRRVEQTLHGFDVGVGIDRSAVFPLSVLVEFDLVDTAVIGGGNAPFVHELIGLEFELFGDVGDLVSHFVDPLIGAFVLGVHRDVNETHLTIASGIVVGIGLPGVGVEVARVAGEVLAKRIRVSHVALASGQTNA